MKNDFRIQYPLWQIGFLLVITWMFFGSNGWILELLSIVNIKISESIDGMIALFSVVLYIIFIFSFMVVISAHNKQNPNQKLSFFQSKPFEYIEDDEGWQFITRNASQKVYSFFSWALPASLLIHLFFKMPQYAVVLNILLLATMQYLVYYRELRKHVREEAE